MSKSKQYANVCITIALRDYAAVEDLLLELDCNIDSVNIVSTTDKPKRKVTRGFHRNQVDAAMVTACKKAFKQWPHHTDAQIKRKLGIPHGVTTINKVRNGYYDHLLETK